MSTKNFTLLLIANIFLLSEFSLNNNAYASDKIQENYSKLDNINQKKIMFADGRNGLCEGKFEHTTGNVTFNTDPTNGKLDFAFQLSPGSRLILGSPVSGYMIQAVVQDYRINPPYGPHLNKPSDYDFHGSILAYNRLGSKGSFRLQTGQKVKFIWLITGVGARSGAKVLRAVECTAV